ncbi:Arylsulfatase [Pirellulimonas nuda]|uniref:Arylsulfatase n=1 Tax=Pirellulimonas nuda TaxID=2528009 RepID=A0A518DAB0_9BACT|nr:sulfatase [Pirellulimonas nuda]QDU88419.1 Arylsulfatase [Pirellulimonas nuda]
MFMNFISTLIVAFLTLGAAFAEQSRPSILFLAIDDLRPELGCYGSPAVKSPNIDKLASQGVLFQRAYCQVAVCGASRASLMTGILPTKDRFVNYTTMADQDTPGAVTLPQALKAAGYTTLSHGKVFHNWSDTAARSWSRPPKMGKDLKGRNANAQKKSRYGTQTRPGNSGSKPFFDRSDVPDDTYADGQVARNTIADLRELAQSGEPFFLACGFIRPHLPFYAPEKYWDLYDADSLPIAKNRFRPHDAPTALRGSGEYRTYDLGKFKKNSDDFHRIMRHGYFASTSYSDKLVGDVLSELEALGLVDNTIVVIWGDHGWHLGEHAFWGKHNTLHNAIRVPLIVKAPGKLQGVTSKALVSTVDLFPTLCSLAGVDVPGSVQGKSFEQLLASQDAQHTPAVYTRFKEADAVVTEGFSYSRFSDGSEMLFDLAKDPDENQNVAKVPEYASQLQVMCEELDQQIKLAQSAQWVPDR